MIQDSLFKTAFQHSSIGMAVVAPDGTWLDVNNSLLKIIGYSKEELLAGNFQNLTHPEDLEPDLKLVNECLDGKRTSYELEKRYIHKNGNIVWALLTVSAIRENGRVKFFISQIQDMTENKLNQQRLIQSSKMAALGEMAGGIAHEINNPLTIIEGQVSVLDMEISKFGITDLGIKDRLNRISSTVRRIHSIVENMKNFSRKGESETGDWRLRDIVEETLGICGEKLSMGRIETKTDLPDELYVTGNRGQLGQVFMNLISNAEQAMKESGARELAIRALDETEHVSVYFEDSGPGIPDDIADKVMKPFFTTKPLGQGTGLGLSLSKEIMVRQGGDLRLLSSSKGACLQVIIPKAKSSSSSAA